MLMPSTPKIEMSEPRWFARSIVTLGLSVLACLNAVQAQTLQLRYTFEDTGTTTASDPGGALSVPLSLLNAGGAATDIHGAAGSGVQNQGKGLDFTATV